MKSMKDIRIKVTCTCEECGGEGVLYNPIWKQYNSFTNDYRNTHGSFDGCPGPDEWARNNGLFGESDMGPEEIVCDECNGPGRRDAELTVDEFLDATGISKNLKALFSHHP